MFLKKRTPCKMLANKYLLLKDYKKAYNLYRKIFECNPIISNSVKYSFLSVMVGKSEEAYTVMKELLKLELKIYNCDYINELIYENLDNIKNNKDFKGLEVFYMILDGDTNGFNSTD